MIVAMILAGGTGTRIGAAVPKQFVEVLGKPVAAYTLDVFQNNANIDAIEIVCHKDWLTEISDIVEKYSFNKVQWITTGGDTFQSSVMNGLSYLKAKLLPDDIVVISFAVSPFTTDDVIDDSICVCKKYGNGISAEDMVLCTCIKDDNSENEQGSSIKPILRETIKGFGNPWTFRFGELCEAYETAEKQGILNDLEPHTTSLYFALGKRIFFSKAGHYISKITYKEDLDMFEAYLRLKKIRECE